MFLNNMSHLSIFLYYSTFVISTSIQSLIIFIYLTFYLTFWTPLLVELSWNINTFHKPLKLSENRQKVHEKNCVVVYIMEKMFWFLFLIPFLIPLFLLSLLPMQLCTCVHEHVVFMYIIIIYYNYSTAS